MAYGDDGVTLITFDRVIPDVVFKEVTSITLDQFRFLRDGGDPSQIKTFTYPGRKPHTQEQVLLMLCDSITAKVAA